MLQLYFTRLKCLCRSYDTLFWSFCFPILLAIFFYLGFYNLSSNEKLETISVGVVTDLTIDNEFTLAMMSANISDDKPLFDIQQVQLDEAKALLDDNKIAGYIANEHGLRLFVKENGLEQTIIKSFLDRYIQMTATAKTITAMNPDAINNGLVNDLQNSKNYVWDGSNTSSNPNYTLVYFYTLIALSCLFGTNWGFREMIDISPDQSLVGARVNIAPVHKLRLLVCNLFAAFTLHFISIMFLLVFLSRVLRIDFGNNVDKILLTCLFGSLCGISLGAMVCVSVKANAKVRNSILNVIVLGGGFLAGMVVVEMKYIIATKVPLLGYINPATLITDALYCLYYYDTFEKFYINIVLLALLTAVFSGITYLRVRRKEYASI